MNKVALLCRAGFEKECAAEIAAKAAEQGICGFPRVKENSGYVLFECSLHEEADRLIRQVPFNQLIFARQMMLVGALLSKLSVEDRITPIMGMLMGAIEGAGELRVEVPDTNQGRELLKFCRKLSVPLRNALRQQKLLLLKPNAHRPVLHVLFIAPGCCYVGYSYSNNNSPFYMGIPRLKLPADAPSRSTLKLEEAFHLFIPADEWEERLASGMYAVDLGASPGGWTYQLVKRSMMVYAVDNGDMAPSLMETGQVTHYRADGFKFEPGKHNINWLVCDMVDKPTRITQLIVKWLVNGWCREAIFNLKLPMKKRYQQVYQELEMIRSQLQQNGINSLLQAKQLYHDREEVTVHIQLIWGSVIKNNEFGKR